MSELITIAKFAPLHGVLNQSLYAAVKSAGVEPVHSMQLPRGVLRLYKPEDLMAVLETMRTRKVLPAPGMSASPVLDELEDKVDKLLAMVDKLHAQNAVLLKAIEKVQPTPTVVLGPPQPAFTELVPVENKPKPKPRLPKVLVVGLLNGQKSMIEQEFSPCFDLRFYTTDDAKGKQFEDALRQCDALLVMIAFINHGIEAQAKRCNVKITRVSGGMTSLRDVLTNLFVTMSEAA